LTQQSNGGAVFVFLKTDQIAMLQNDENLKIKLIQMMFRLLIFSFEYGEKNLEGSIGIDTVVETDKNIVITIKETSPEPGSMVTQALQILLCSQNKF
jgi:hypothetical protein